MNALCKCERVLGPDHLNTLAARNNLAGALDAAGRFDEAITLYDELQDSERVLGPDDSAPWAPAITLAMV